MGEVLRGPSPATPVPPPIWTSTDAIHWQQIGRSDAFPNAVRLMIKGLVWTGSRFVAVGSVLGEQRPLAWTSPDGHVWAAGDMGADLKVVESAEPTGLARVGSTLVAVGFVQDGLATRPIVWESGDGATWQRVFMPAALDGIMLRGIGAESGQVVVWGEQFDPGGQLAQGAAVDWSLTPIAPSPSAAAAAVGPEVDQFGLIDARHGWAISGRQLFLTLDSRHSWRWSRDLGPVGALAHVTFLDAAHGWIVPFLSTEGDPVAIARTSDGGKTWQETALRIPSGYPTAASFFDAQHGVLPLEGAGGRAGSLWATSDGGATWSRVGTIPAAIVGAITFGDRETGWALAASNPSPVDGRPSVNELYVTSDGGASWQRSVLPRAPAGWATSAWQPFLTSPPSVFGPGRAVLVADYGGGATSATQLLLTGSVGRTWTVATTIPEWVWSFAALSDYQWLAAYPDHSDAAPSLHATNDGGRTWTAVTATGLVSNATSARSTSSIRSTVGRAWMARPPVEPI